MNFVDHLKLGLAIGLAGSGAFFILAKENIAIGSALCFVFCGISSLFADIDTKSVISKMIFIVSIAAVIIGFLLNNLFLPLLAFFLFLVIHFLVPHRTLTHTLMFAIGFAAVTFFICFQAVQEKALIVSAAALLAYLSHLLLDKN